MDELEQLSLTVRDVIFKNFEEESDYYIGELISSPEGVFRVAAELCDKYEED